MTVAINVFGSAAEEFSQRQYTPGALDVFSGNGPGDGSQM
ncbi:unnamed protein product, partial [marine sediment metagenome]